MHEKPHIPINTNQSKMLQRWHIELSLYIHGRRAIIN